MVGNQCVWEDSDLVNLGDFNFAQWYADHTVESNSWAAASKSKVKLKHCNATMSYKNLPKAQHVTVSVMTEEGWQKVQSFVKKWMKALRVNISLKLAAYYTETKREAPPEEPVNDSSKKKVETSQILR